MNTNTKILFEIYTPFGAHYLINGKGEISTNGLPFSGNWKIKGIESVKSNFFISFKDITKERIHSMELKYKNGNPKYTVRDLDHGTTRTWGNTKMHGIASIYFRA